MRFIIPVALLSVFANAQELTPASLTLTKSNTIELADFSRDHMPFTQIDMSSTDSVLVMAQCHFDIQWKTAEVDDEEIEYSFEDLFLKTDSAEKVLPIGETTMDQRVNIGPTLKHVSVDAREEWKHTQLRFTALFLVNKTDSKFTIHFAGKDYETKLSDTVAPARSEYAKNTLVKAELISADKRFNTRASRDLPGAKLKLENPEGKLLSTTVSLTPQLPNVMGGELRYIYRPSDYSLVANGQVLQPIGFLDGDDFGLDSIYNLSRTDLEEMRKIESEISLVFPVPADFSEGQLLFLGTSFSEVKIQP